MFWLTFSSVATLALSLSLSLIWNRQKRKISAENEQGTILNKEPNGIRISKGLVLHSMPNNNTQSALLYSHCIILCRCQSFQVNTSISLWHHPQSTKHPHHNICCFIINRNGGKFYRNGQKCRFFQTKSENERERASEWSENALYVARCMNIVWAICFAS